MATRDEIDMKLRAYVKSHCAPICGNKVGRSLSTVARCAVLRHPKSCLESRTVMFWARRSESRPIAARKVDHLRV
jgi:hypothetical protein